MTNIRKTNKTYSFTKKPGLTIERLILRKFRQLRQHITNIMLFCICSPQNSTIYSVMLTLSFLTKGGPHINKFGSSSINPHVVSSNNSSPSSSSLPVYSPLLSWPTFHLPDGPSVARVQFPKRRCPSSSAGSLDDKISFTASYLIL